MRAVRGLRVLVLAAAALFALAALRVAADEPARMDFVAQYAAASLVRDGRGPSILDADAIRVAEHAAAPERVALLPFVQPPATALLLSPLASLSFERAFGVMAAIDGVLVALSLALLGGGAWGRALLFVAPPSALAVAQGQLTPLVLLFVAIALRVKSPRVGGVAVGLTLIRPQTAPLLILAGVMDPARRWWTLGASLAVVALSAAAVGVDGLVRYAGVLAAASEWSVTGDLGIGGSLGWAGTALAFGAGWVGIAASLLSLVAGAVAVGRARAPDRATVAATWSLLASPHVLVHDAVLAYPAVIALASRGRPWDLASVVAWIAHVLVAPVGVLWTLSLAIAHSRAARVRPAVAGALASVVT